MMKYSKSVFNTKDEEKAFVKSCEQDFEARLDELSEYVCAEKDLKVITLSGPTCSGKTTASKKLESVLAKHSKRLNIISIDDFYFDKEILHEISRKKGMKSVDYDSADTIDFECLGVFVDEIFDRKQSVAHCPIFDFKEGKRTGYRTLECTDSDIFVFEGIQALYPQFRALFDTRKFYDIYICAQSGIDVDGTVFEPNEIRLLRRLVRDYNFRASSPEFTFGLWKNVRKNEDINIFPNISECEYLIDSTFACEISLLKPYLDSILCEVESSSPYYASAQEIIKKITHVSPFSKDYISENSLYNEFI